MDTLLFVLIAGPVGAGFAALLFGRIDRRLRDIWALVAAGGVFGISVLVFALVAGPRGACWAWRLSVLTVLPAPLLVVDRISVFWSVIFSAVFFILILYSTGYLRIPSDQRDPRAPGDGQVNAQGYYALFFIMIGGVIGSVFAANLLLLYVCWETAALAAWRMARWLGSSPSGRTGKVGFLTVNFVGSALLLAGFSALFFQYRTLTIFDLSRVPVKAWVGALLAAGILLKSSGPLLVVWPVPGRRPPRAPIGAVAHAIIGSIGIVVFIRILVQGPVVPPVVSGVVAGGGVAVALIAGVWMLFEKDYLRILSVSTLGQFAVIFTGFSLGSFWGVVGGLVAVASHCLAKTGLFLAFGIVERHARERNIDRLGGLVHVLPVTGVATFILVLSVAGIAPLPGFFGQLLIVGAAARAQVALAAALVLAAMMNLVGFARLFRRVFLGGPTGGGRVREPRLLAGTVVALVVLSAACGLGIALILGFFNRFEIACSIS